MKQNAKPIHVAVTKEGSLGVLALGAKGIRAWRAAQIKENVKSENAKSE